MAKETQTHALPAGFKLQSKERVYEIVKVLGSGSFGITYLAVGKVEFGNITTTLKVAIKEHFMSASCYRAEDGATVLTVPAAQSDVVDSRADFITEAKRLQKMCLKSRNIVSVNETFEANGTAYYVMEFLDGGSPVKCSEEEAVNIVMQIAGALKEIHSEHVLHLDLKPDNIVLKTDEKDETYPVLIDFGIAKHFDVKGRPTSSLSAKGASPGYAPQEQYAGVTEFSSKYDIYALGAVLFFLVTGKNPPDAFKISPNQQELKKDLDGIVSPNIEKAILNAMKPSAAERTPTLERFCDDLRGKDFTPVLNIETSKLSFDNDKGEQTIEVDANINWTVSTDEGWCKVMKKGKEVIVSVAKNKEVSGRQCNILISGTSYGLFQTVNVNQQGKGTEILRKKEKRKKEERNGLDIDKRYLYWIGAGVIAAGCILAVIFLSGNDEAELTPSERLTEAINTQNYDDLREFAELDSARAFYPFALLSSQKNYYGDAYHYAKKALVTPDSLLAVNLLEDLDNNSNVEVVYSEEPIDGAEEEVAVGEEAPVHAEEVAPTPQAAQVPEETKPSGPTDDELFAKASSLNDYKALADRKYAKAYAPLAEAYLKNHDYDNAHKWVQRAISSRTGLDKAREVVRILELYGYYDNGEHGGKPNI